MNTRSSLGKWRSIFTKKKIIVMMIILVVFTGRWLLKWWHPPMPGPNKLVEVTTLKKQTLQETIRLLGTIRPKHATVLVAKSSGILDSLVPTGQKITKGTLIAKIDNPALSKNVRLSATTESIAKNQFDRLSPLIAKGYVSTKDAEEKKQAWIDAQKEGSKTKIEWDNLRFYAPFDGIIGAYKKREGTQVNVGDPVVAIYDPSSLIVDVDIPCSNLSSLHEGQAVFVHHKPYSLSHLQKMLDEDTHMCPADIDIQCDDCLMGATTDVDLVVAEKKGCIVIPFQALFLRNSQPHVYIVEQGKVVLVPVKMGLKQQDTIEITEGLKEGAQLIIKGQERLQPDMPVDIDAPTLPHKAS